MLYGAIAGDIAGSVREFRGMKGDEVEFITNRCRFTDDTILTIAVADAIMNNMPMAEALRTYANLYPRPMGGYGTRFVYWLMEGAGAPAYNSCGNGSAMRVSACAWAADTMDEVLRLAHLSAECTHNHPEGIKGAEATAAAIFLARKGKSKNEIRDYIQEHYYDLSSSYDDLRNEPYEFHATCQDTVPQAIICFLHSEDYESAVRMAMLTNRDTDTAGAICGAIAGAYYGVPSDIKAKVRQLLDEHLLNVLDKFENYFTRKTPDVPTYNSFRVGDDRIWACEYPFHYDEEKGKAKLQQAIDFGITHFIDLTEEGELKPYAQCIPAGSMISHERFAVVDNSAPDSVEHTMVLLEKMDSILQNPNARIYLHCWGGVGRTCTIVACWLAWKRKLGFYGTMRALKELWSACPKSTRRTAPDTEEQVDFIHDFIGYLQNSKRE